MIERIDDILNRIIEETGSDQLEDILSHLQITIMPLPEQAYILNTVGACYIRNGESKVIWYSDGLLNKKFAIAHELAHMILHDDMQDFCYYNPLENKLKQEREANYFATKLLYSDYELEEGIHTREQLADRLGIDIDFTKFIFGN